MGPRHRFIKKCQKAKTLSEVGWLEFLEILNSELIFGISVSRCTRNAIWRLHPEQSGNMVTLLYTVLGYRGVKLQGR